MRDRDKFDPVDQVVTFNSSQLAIMNKYIRYMSLSWKL